MPAPALRASCAAERHRWVACRKALTKSNLPHGPWRHLHRACVTSCGSQIQFLGSDGHRYLFLAKPKDDLRKDARMMEMMGVLNRLLAKHPASRRRNLFVRRCACKECHPNWGRHIQCLLGVHSAGTMSAVAAKQPTKIHPASASAHSHLEITEFEASLAQLCSDSADGGLRLAGEAITLPVSVLALPQSLCTVLLVQVCGDSADGRLLHTEVGATSTCCLQLLSLH